MDMIVEIRSNNSEEEEIKINIRIMAFLGSILKDVFFEESILKMCF